MFQTKVRKIKEKVKKKSKGICVLNRIAHIRLHNLFWVDTDMIL